MRAPEKRVTSEANDGWILKGLSFVMRLRSVRAEFVGLSASTLENHRVGCSSTWVDVGARVRFKRVDVHEIDRHRAGGNAREMRGNRFGYGVRSAGSIGQKGSRGACAKSPSAR